MYEKMMRSGKEAYIDTTSGKIITVEEHQRLEAEPGLGEVESESTTALDELLSVIDLDSPLMVTDYAGNKLPIDKERFVRYYMPQGATQSEVYHCYQAVRASGLSLLVPGECYFFKTADGPIKLFTGYPAYLRKAYANGLEHIEKPEIEFDENGKPILCTITLKIKGRPDHIWPTYFDEVAGAIAGGKLNKRWTKAPIFQLIKCATVNALRFSGLVDFTLPHIVDEMPERLDERGFWEGMETGTDDTKSLNLTAGEVSATHHQVDLAALRRTYFGMVMPKKENGVIVSPGLFTDDDQRHRWQLHISGSESASDWGVEDYAEAFRLINSGEAAKWVAEDNKPDSDPPDDVEVIQKPEKPEPGAKGFPADDAQMTEEETTAFFRGETERREDQATTKDGTPVEEAVKDAVREGVKQTEELDNVRQEFFDLAKRKFASDEDATIFARTILGARNTAWSIEDCKTLIAEASEMDDYKAGEIPVKNAVENDGEESVENEVYLGDQIVDLLDGYEGNIRNDFASLAAEKFPVMAERMEWVTTNIKPPDGSWTDDDYAKGIILLRELPDGSQDDGDGLPPILTGETYDAIRKLVIASGVLMRSKEFRDKAKGIIGHKYNAFKTIREHEGQKILAELEKEAEPRVVSQSGVGEIVDDDPLNQGEFEADATDDKDLVPPGLLTDEQYEEIEFLVGQMPERFRMGTEDVRIFIARTIRENDASFRYTAIRKLTDGQGDIVIAAQKDFIRDEVDRKNAMNKPLNVRQ